MINLDTFYEDMNKISEKLKEPKKYCGVDLNITKECNFRCVYCYEGNSCFGVDDIEDQLNSIFLLVDNMVIQEWWLERFNGIQLGIWGGEPTLRPEILRRIVDRYKDNSTIEYLIYTNGQDADVIIDIFGCIKDRVEVQVSYDGGQIHVNNRPDKHGKVTTDICKNAVRKLHNFGFKVHIKSTIDPRTDLPLMVDAWEDIKEFNDEIGDNIKYAITPDNIRDSEFDLDLFRRVMKDIAKREIRFYEEKRYHLMHWFDGAKIKCVYFEGGFFVDTNGDLMHCHGCGYVDNKSDFIFGNVADDDVLDKIYHNMSRFKNPETPTCDECISTICLCCNSAKYINSNKDNFMDKWYDFTCQKSHCKLFKEFGKIDRAVKEILGR